MVDYPRLKRTGTRNAAALALGPQASPPMNIQDVYGFGGSGTGPIPLQGPIPPPGAMPMMAATQAIDQAAPQQPQQPNMWDQPGIPQAYVEQMGVPLTGSVDQNGQRVVAADQNGAPADNWNGDPMWAAWQSAQAEGASALDAAGNAIQGPQPRPVAPQMPMMAAAQPQPAPAPPQPGRAAPAAIPMAAATARPVQQVQQPAPMPRVAPVAAPAAMPMMMAAAPQPMQLGDRPMDYSPAALLAQQNYRGHDLHQQLLAQQKYTGPGPPSLATMTGGGGER